uniref:Uncharacterized protein n=1 Tax=Leersia perrieri TaxID=77586 RepID=A0A0D9XPY6_9ORYZ
MMIPESVHKLVGDLTKQPQQIEYARREMTPVQIERVNRQRVRKYQNLMLLGVSSVFWSDTKNAINKMEGLVLQCACNAYLNFALASMFLGAIASTLPEVAKHYRGVSANGVLQGIIFAIVAFNIETYSNLTKPEELHKAVWWTSGPLSVLAVTIYWTVSTEEPIVPWIDDFESLQLCGRHSESSMGISLKPCQEKAISKWARFATFNTNSNGEYLDDLNSSQGESK